MADNSLLLHATCVAIDGRGVLIVGPSGSGKSDLALRLLMTAFREGARDIATGLVADDQVLVMRQGPLLMAQAPEVLKDKLELRGYGIGTIASTGPTPVVLIADIGGDRPEERMPDPREQRDILGVGLPVMRLDARHASAAAKLVFAALRPLAD